MVMMLTSVVALIGDKSAVVLSQVGKVSGFRLCFKKVGFEPCTIIRDVQLAYCPNRMALNSKLSGIKPIGSDFSGICPKA